MFVNRYEKLRGEEEKEKGINRRTRASEGSPPSSPHVPSTSCASFPLRRSPSAPSSSLSVEGIGTNGMNPQVLIFPLLSSFLSTGSPRVSSPRASLTVCGLVLHVEKDWEMPEGRKRGKLGRGIGVERGVERGESVSKGEGEALICAVEDVSGVRMAGLSWVGTTQRDQEDAIQSGRRSCCSQLRPTLFSSPTARIFLKTLPRTAS